MPQEKTEKYKMFKQMEDKPYSRTKSPNVTLFLIILNVHMQTSSNNASFQIQKS